MDNTIDEIVNASELPLSIVIVGVGDGILSVLLRVTNQLISRTWKS